MNYDALLAGDKCLKGLVERYGAERVFRTGLRVLGHPVWMPSNKDALTIQAALESED